MSYFYTDEQKAFLREAIPGRTWQETSRLYAERFGEALTRGQVIGMRQRLGVASGMIGCRPGTVPSNGLPVGSARLDGRGNEWVKVCENWRDNPDNEGMAERPNRGCWRRRSHVEWERIHGSRVPEGMRIVFANSDNADFSPENLVAVPHGVLSAINALRLRYYDAPSLRACMRIAEIKMGLKSSDRLRTSTRRPWSDDEDGMILSSASSDRALSVALGRSVSAVKNRRCRLLKERRNTSG